MSKLVQQYKNLDKEITNDLENIKKSYVSLGEKLMIAKRIYETDPIAAVKLFTEDNFTHYCMSKDLNPKSADRIIRARNVHLRLKAAGVTEDRIARVKDYTKLTMINFAKNDIELKSLFGKAEIYHRYELQQVINRIKNNNNDFTPDPLRLVDYKNGVKEFVDYLKPKANKNEVIHATTVLEKLKKIGLVS